MTEIETIPNRGHSLTIDSGWREVADKALAFVQRFVAPDAGQAFWCAARVSRRVSCAAAAG